MTHRSYFHIVLGWEVMARSNAHCPGALVFHSPKRPRCFMFGLGGIDAKAKGIVVGDVVQHCGPCGGYV